MGGIDGIKTPYIHVKREIPASKSIFHSFHAVLWSMGHTQKNDIPMHLGQVLKRQKILVSNIFYHFLVPFHLAIWMSKVSEKNLGWIVKLVFKIRSTQNASML